MKFVLFSALVGWPLAIGLAVPHSGLWGWSGLRADQLELLTFLLAIVPVGVALAVLERLIPYRRDWIEGKSVDFKTDFTHVLVNWFQVGQVSRYLTGGFALYLNQHSFTLSSGGPWPHHWPLVAQVGLALAVSEFGHYWVHRAGHEVPFLWKFHSVHHSVTRLYWFNATRFHVLELLLLTVVQILPLIVLGCGKEAFLVYSGITTIFGWLQHTNADVRPGFLNYLFASNELHQWHHSKILREGNSNYGAVLSVWDLAFNTFFWPRGARFESPAGLHGDPQFPKGYFEQQWYPFHDSQVPNEVPAFASTASFADTSRVPVSHSMVGQDEVFSKPGNDTEGLHQSPSL